ncbi:polyketide cyclase [Natronosporangium hydrolyticum]|uniref:Polyketide cyclase n=1 Tax=Natronosporangium hydrolyticum TaxID=2811111 RepID=A0A895YIN2_9ACTN|nr:polyketide cyclase [Natronosporangium hydrolyticum]QSB15389.1 polyketide cyclase [Natronosporangium hydrolyticum]
MSLEPHPDRVEREIVIDAPQWRVWELVSQPGWWINDGEVVPHRFEADGPGRTLVHDPVHGTFAVATIDARPPAYAAFRWHCGPTPASRVGPLTTATSTLVEFFLAPVDSASVTLRVVESGFASLAESARQRRQLLEENTTGWQEELAAAARHLTRAPR